MSFMKNNLEAEMKFTSSADEENSYLNVLGNNVVRYDRGFIFSEYSNNENTPTIISKL